MVGIMFGEGTIDKGGSRGISKENWRGNGERSPHWPEPHERWVHWMECYVRCGWLHRTTSGIHQVFLFPPFFFVLKINPSRCESRMILYYDLFDYVLRNHWHEKLERYGEKLLWLPLGTTHGFGTPTLNSIIPASMRKFRCSFRGCKWEARRSFFDALAKLESANDLYCELNWSMKFRDGIDIRGN